MGRRLLLGALVLGIAWTAAVAEETAEKTAEAAPPEIKAYHLFQAAGTSWAYRTLVWERGAEPYEWYTWHSVEDLRDDTAAVEFRSPGNPDPELRSGTHAIDLKFPPLSFRRSAEQPLTRETVDVGFLRLDCVRDSRMEGDERVVSWVSVDYHPLVVREIRTTYDTTQVTTLLSLRTGRVDPFLLYRMEGRSWISRTEDAAETTLRRWTVSEVETDRATIKITHEDETGMHLSQPEVRQINFDDPEFRLPAFGQSEVKTTLVGELECLPVNNDDGSTSWYARQYPTLEVLRESEASRTELVEFNNGHRNRMFLDQLGNRYVQRNLRIVRGKARALNTHCDVFTVEPDVTAVELTWQGQEGSARYVYLRRYVRDDVREAIPGGLVREELIHTPAGVFVAQVRDYAEGEYLLRRWYHRDVVVYQERVNEHSFAVSEVLELTLQ